MYCGLFDTTFFLRLFSVELESPKMDYRTNHRKNYNFLVKTTVVQTLIIDFNPTIWIGRSSLAFQNQAIICIL